MSASKYKFVSPGVFVREIDRSQVAAPVPDIGPVIIGRAERGPAMRPVSVNSYSEYVETFGDTVPGGRGGDVWREGNYTSPMYATYAAQAWLRNGRTATVVRLLGEENANKTAGGEAGWTIDNATASAYGLFLIDSGTTATEELTGLLSAVWYFPNIETANNSITLSGTIRNGASIAATASNAAVIQSVGASAEFTAVMTSGSSNSEKAISFNFNPDSDKFIRKAFNTNPILTNAGLTQAGNIESHWLAHTFEDSVVRNLNSGSSAASAGDVYGIMLRLGNTPEFLTNFADHKFGQKAAQSGWIISQDMRGTTYSNFDPMDETYVTKLFRVHSLGSGEWDNRELKISIKDIKASPNEDVDPFGTFTVQLRRAYDSDNAVRVVEEFNNCNLNPNSPNFLARKIGDSYATWDDDEKRFRVYGDYPNMSKFVRIEMNNEVAQGSTDSRLLPFGFWGPYRPKQFTIINHNPPDFNMARDGQIGTRTFATSSGITNMSGAATFPRIDVGTYGAGGFGTSSFIYPTIALRANSSDALLTNHDDAYFGYDSTRSGAATRFAHSNIDLLRSLPANLSLTSTGSVQVSVAFSLDDLVVDGENDGKGTYTSGSRKAGTSATALTGTYTSVIDTHEFNRFTTPMWGGYDGWDIREMDPVANRNIAGTDVKANYELNTVRRAIEACSDPEHVDFNLMVAPGLCDSNNSITDLMVNVCEERGDAMAIIDLPSVYSGPQEGKAYASFTDRVGTLTSVANTFRDRRKNSSYGATYYPWVQIRDSKTGTSLWAPPSVVALGTFAHSDRVGELWFAPAGFNRGGLSQGSSGLVVSNVSERLSSVQRDTLYERNINPIASFPNEGIVIFGQKTMDATTSALNRINVRRLLIFLKKEVSRLANQVLFDQNIQATWGRFQALVRPLLESVKVRFGLADYKLVLDETTTTPDLIDRNIMYAKIFLKPARAIEFIALDFIITRSGASFDD